MISVEAPAKLTLSLAITGVREDGYHLIDAEMVSLTICDDIVIEEAETTSINVVGKFAQGVPTDDSNLVARALHLLNRHAEVRIEKTFRMAAASVVALVMQQLFFEQHALQTSLLLLD